MNQFTFILKDNNQKAFNTFFWFIILLHVIAVSVIFINPADNQKKIIAIATISLFLLLSVVFYLLKNIFKLSAYQLLVFILLVFFWVAQSAFLPALVITTVIAFAFYILQKKSTAVFSTESIIITKLLFKKAYNWSEAENVILKDNLLSVDLKNNHLMQAEITGDNFESNEEEFNQFCKKQLNP